MTKNKSIRKSMSLLVCLSLLSALLLICSGCGSKDKEALIGTWETTIDMTDMLNQELKAGMGNDEELMSYFNISDFKVKIILEFNDDDTYKMTADEAAMEASVDSLIDTFRDGITKYFEDMIAQEGLEMTVDEVLGQMGMTMDSFMDQMFDKDDLMSSVDDMESSGTFEAKDSILYLTDDEGTGLEAYELDGDKLTLTGEGVDDSDLEGLYPLVFNKK